MASGQKRIRTTNFTKEEQLMLVEIIKKHKETVENKASDKVSWREKVYIFVHCLLLRSNNT